MPRQEQWNPGVEKLEIPEKDNILMEERKPSSLEMKNPLEQGRREGSTDYEVIINSIKSFIESSRQDLDNDKNEILKIIATKETTEEQLTQDQDIKYNEIEEFIETVMSFNEKMECLEDISAFNQFISNIDQENRKAKQFLLLKKDKIAETSKEKEGLFDLINKLNNELERENNRSGLARAFTVIKRRQLSTRTKELNEKFSRVWYQLNSYEKEVKNIEKAIEIVDYEIPKKALEKHLDDIFSKYHSFSQEFQRDEIIDFFNNELIQKYLMPHLNKAKGDLSEKEINEFVEIIKGQLRDGAYMNFADGNAEQIEERNTKLKQLLNKIDNEISKNISSAAYHSLSIRQQHLKPDEAYGFIFKIIFSQEISDRLKEIQDFLENIKDSSKKDKLETALKKKNTKNLLSYSSFSNLEIKGKQGYFDLNKVSDFILRLQGLERWPIIRNEFEDKIISSDIFEEAEEIIIKRLFKMVYSNLHPNAVLAASQMSKFHNPKALPLLLEYLQNQPNRSSVVDQSVVISMKNLLESCKEEKLEKVLDDLAENKRLLINLLKDKNSYLSQQPTFNIAYLLEKGDLTLVKEEILDILKDDGNLDNDEIRSFYLNFQFNPTIIQALLENRESIEDIIVQSKSDVWLKHADKILAEFVDPKNGTPMELAKKVLQKGMKISDPKYLQILEDIFNNKNFKKNKYERKTFLRGLLLLNSKEDGRLVLETIFNSYKGSKNDYKKIRKILQSLETLDDFDEYEFVTPESYSDNFNQFKKLEKELRGQEESLVRLEADKEEKEKENNENISNLSKKHNQADDQEKNDIQKEIDKLQQKFKLDIEPVNQKIKLIKQEIQSNKEKLSLIQEKINLKAFEGAMQNKIVQVFCDRL
ncbi:MAG: hypothetical protein GF335_01960, partial [Candidatus Moranbacteria bacterium]|nr:hypothetical protein [Candidatus Moranbacteria bacterium]